MTVTNARRLEDWGFLVACALGALYGVAEAAARTGLCLGTCPANAEFPWGLLIMQAIMAAPKMVGRVSAGKVWEAVGRKIGGPAA